MAVERDTPGDPFSLHIAHRACLIRAASRAARPILEAVTGLNQLRALYARARTGGAAAFETRALAALDVRLRVVAHEHAVVPSEGPLIVAANHPTGALDGLLLSEVVRQVRPDVKVLANRLLARIPELHAATLFVDPFAGPSAAARSAAGLRAAHRWLIAGGALVMFPAGEVAWRRDERGVPIDSPWASTMERLARKTGAAILPVFIEADNSRLFYASGRLHPALRTVLLAREFVNKRGRTVCVHLAPAVSAPPANRDGTSLTIAVRGALSSLPLIRRDEPVPVVDPIEAARLEADLHGLPADAKLLSSGAFDVYCAGAGSLPNVLREIGRVRELTFRAVGEGTGRAIDLDRFDAHYAHLFVWQRARREVVGAYRIGATDEILADRGLDGLYTRTLFRYDARLLQRIGPALELGRSFVRREYQRSHNPLLLLWKGIGKYVARAPRYRVLFGPVSISSRYQDSSQRLLRAFLAEAHGDPALAALVDPINPPPPLLPPPRDSVAGVDVSDLDARIARIEGSQGMPVLLRQYLRLNAVLLGFNVDPAFGDALDALMMVDLVGVERAILHRYLGPDAHAFLEHHRRSAA